MIVKRKKKWLGSIVSGVVNTGLGILSSKRQQELQDEALKEQQRIQTQQLAMQNANNLTSKYSDMSYADVMQDKIIFKAGGKTKDRVAVAKKFACGGRKRKAFGSNIDNNNSNFIANTNDISNIKNDFTMARMGAKFKRKCSK